MKTSSSTATRRTTTFQSPFHSIKKRIFINFYNSLLYYTYAHKPTSACYAVVVSCILFSLLFFFSPDIWFLVLFLFSSFHYSYLIFLQSYFFLFMPCRNINARYPFHKKIFYKRNGVDGMSASHKYHMLNSMLSQFQQIKVQDALSHARSQLIKNWYSAEYTW